MTRWRLVREETRPPAVQMALDEVAARTAGSGGPATVRAYRWEPPALSVGYAQDAAVVDRAAAERAGVAVVRRRTGGGAIYHDPHGDISYSVAAPADAFEGPRAAYRACCAPIIDALETVGVDAGFADVDRPARHEAACYLRGLSPAHDLVVDGRKVGGNAQYRTREATLQHGSLVYATAPERHRSLFADPPDAAAFVEQVTAVSEATDTTRPATVAALEDALAAWAGAEAGGWTDDELAAARGLADRKYRTRAWTRRGEDPTDGAQLPPE